MSNLRERQTKPVTHVLRDFESTCCKAPTWTSYVDGKWIVRCAECNRLVAAVNINRTDTSN